MKRNLKTIGIYAFAFLVAIQLTNCKAIDNANNTQKGGAIGATGGAIIGAIIGNNVGDGDKSELGAVIGGVVGGTAGVLIGRKMDKEAQRIEEEIPGAQVERVENGIVLTFDEKSGVYFATNKSNLNQESEETLSKLASIFNEYDDTNILVVGHTDSTGNAEYNMELSKNRAFSVSNYLMDKGINAGRITTEWFGETKPMHDNSTTEGRTKNRRVNIAIVPNEQMIREAQQEAGN